MIARYHPESNEISMQYFIDEIDEMPVFGRFPMGLGMTSFVVRSRHAQLIDRKRLKQLIAAGDIQQVLGNIDTYSWMGAPMMAQEQLYGVIIIQSLPA